MIHNQFMNIFVEKSPQFTTLIHSVDALSRINLLFLDFVSHLFHLNFSCGIWEWSIFNSFGDSDYLQFLPILYLRSSAKLGSAQTLITVQ